jgi:hypothetical protein
LLMCLFPFLVCLFVCNFNHCVKKVMLVLSLSVYVFAINF